MKLKIIAGVVVALAVLLGVAVSCGVTVTSQPSHVENNQP